MDATAAVTARDGAATKAGRTRSDGRNVGIVRQSTGTARTAAHDA
jgi:hypothetical protein